MTNTSPSSTGATRRSSPFLRALWRFLSERWTALLVAAGIVGFALTDGGYGPISRHAAGVVVWLFLIGLALAAPGRLALTRTVVRGAGAIALFALVSALSMLWSESAGRSFEEATRVLLFLGVFLVVAALARTAAGRRQVVSGVLVGTVTVMAIALLSRLEPSLFHDQGLNALAPELRTRLAYPLGYWNAIGVMASMAVLLLLYEASREAVSARHHALATAALPGIALVMYETLSRGAFVWTALGGAVILWVSPRRTDAGRAAAIGALGGGLLIIGSRRADHLNAGLLDAPGAATQGHLLLAGVIAVSAGAAWLSLIAERAGWANGVGAWCARRRRPLAVLGGVLALAAVIAIAPKLIDHAKSVTDATVAGQATTSSRLGSASLNGRYQFWASAFDAFKNKPIAGHGAGAWEFWWRRHATINAPIHDSHSIVMDVAAELGLIGLAALAAMFGAALLAFLRQVRQSAGDERAAAASVAAAALAYTASSLVDWSWETSALTVVFFALFAVAATAVDERAVAAQPARAEPARRGGAILALAGVAWLLAIVQAVGLTGSWSLAKSEDAVARGDLVAARRNAETARRVEPWSADPYRQLALVSLRRLTDRRALGLARSAVDRERTNWQNWYVLVIAEARLGELGKATNDLTVLRSLARGSPLIPSFQDLQAMLYKPLS